MALEGAGVPYPEANIIIELNQMHFYVHMTSIKLCLAKRQFNHFQALTCGIISISFSILNSMSGADGESSPLTHQSNIMIVYICKC